MDEESLNPKKGPSLQPRAVDGGLWTGPKIPSTHLDQSFLKWWKLERTKEPDQVMQSTRRDFLKALSQAYQLGKGQR